MMEWVGDCARYAKLRPQIDYVIEETESSPD